MFCFYQFYNYFRKPNKKGNTFLAQREVFLIIEDKITNF